MMKNKMKNEQLPKNEARVTRVWRNKNGEVTAAKIAGLRIRPSLSYPGLWADENGDIWSELRFKKNAYAIRRGERTELAVQDRMTKLTPRYNDGLAAAKPYPRVQYPAFDYEDVLSHNLRVHIIVCEAWNGPKPFDGAVVDHIDGDKHNNRPDNLEWVTTKENNKRALELGLLKRDKHGRFRSIDFKDDDEQSKE